MYVFGIDFGTSNSCITVWSHHHNTIRPISSFITGQQVFQTRVDNITHFKRLIGVTYSQFQNNNDLQAVFKAYTIEKDKHSPYCTVNGIPVSDLTAQFFSQMRSMASQFSDSIDAVITIPAYFNDIQRNHILDACRTANIHPLRVLNEPTAAALAYTRDNDKNSCQVLVIDCGGGTTDMSLVSIDTEESVYQVMQIEGEAFLGGEDLTQMLCTWISGQHRCNPKNMYTLAESAKQELSFVTNTKICIESLGVVIPLSRPQFINITQPFWKKISTMLNKFYTSKVEQIVFVGGTTKIPYLKEMCQNVFGPTIPICNSLHPEKTVAIGAAFYGSLLKEPERHDILLLDAVPMSLGVKTSDDISNVIISKGNPTPISRTQVFTNSESGIDNISIEVFAGERRCVKFNQHVASFQLTGLDKTLSKGQMRIAVTFTVDENGLLSVTAQDLTSNKTTNRNIMTQKMEIPTTDENEANIFEDVMWEQKIDAIQELRRAYDFLKPLQGKCEEKFRSIDRILLDPQNYTAEQLLQIKEKFEKDVHEFFSVGLK